MPPRTTAADLDVNEVAAMGPLKLSLMIAPPLPVAVLFVKTLLLKLKDPVPGVCPLKLAVNVSTAPPLLPAVLWLNVVPVTTRFPVEASCVGAEGSKPIPAPLLEDWEFAATT